MEVKDLFQVEESIKISHGVAFPKEGLWAPSVYTGFFPEERTKATVEQQKQHWKDAFNSGDVQKYHKYLASKGLSASDNREETAASEHGFLPETQGALLSGFALLVSRSRQRANLGENMLRKRLSGLIG